MGGGFTMPPGAAGAVAAGLAVALAQVHNALVALARGLVLGVVRGGRRGDDKVSEAMRA